MQLSDVFLSLGEDGLNGLLRGISMGRLRTYQMYDRVKVRLHLNKLNSETLRKSAPRLRARLSERDEELATELAQAVLVSHMDMIREILSFLGIPNEDGFFAKDATVSSYLTEGWQERVYEKFGDKYPKPLLVFYLNHLLWEVNKDAEMFAPAA